MSLLANLCTGQKFPAYQLCNLELAQLLLWTSMLAAWAVLKKHLQLALETFSHAFANLAAKLKFLQAFSAWDLCTQRSWDWNCAFQIFTGADENLQSLDWFLQASAKKLLHPKIMRLESCLFRSSQLLIKILKAYDQFDQYLVLCTGLDQYRQWGRRQNHQIFKKKFLRGNRNWSYFIPLHGATPNTQWTHPLQ